MNQASAANRQAREYALGWGIDLFSGLNLKKDAELLPVLMPMDNHGRPIIHLRQDEGVDYYFSRIDYFDSRNHVVACRRIYLILPGYRNQSAYLPVEGRTKIIEVHRGLGYLMMSSPVKPGDEDESFSTAIYQLNPSVTPAVTVAPDTFYTFEAASWHREPLVLSELITEQQLATCQPFEIPLKAYQDSIKTDRERVAVPEDFFASNFH